MNLFFLHHHDPKNQKDPADKHPHVHHPHDMSEGSEFIDDAIHFEDLPVANTEESTAARNPEQSA